MKHISFLIPLSQLYHRISVQCILKQTSGSDVLVLTEKYKWDSMGHGRPAVGSTGYPCWLRDVVPEA